MPGTNTIACPGVGRLRLLVILFPKCKAWHSSHSSGKIDRAKHGTLMLASMSEPTMSAIFLHSSVNTRYQCYKKGTRFDAEALMFSPVIAGANQYPSDCERIDWRIVDLD